MTIKRTALVLIIDTSYLAMFTHGKTGKSPIQWATALGLDVFNDH